MKIKKKFIAKLLGQIFNMFIKIKLTTRYDFRMMLEIGLNYMIRAFLTSKIQTFVFAMLD